MWYGELILCFTAAYRPGVRRNDLTLCFVRWLDTVAVVARVERRSLTAAEQAGPFDAFRWATNTGSYKRGHPRHGTHYGIVSTDQLKYRAPIFPGPSESVDAADPLLRLITDMLRRF